MASEYRIDIVTDPGSSRAAIKAVDKDLKGLEGSADSLRRTLTSAFAAAGITVGLGAGIGLLKDFSQEMSTVAAVSDATAAEFDALKDSALDLGSTTRFSATEAAQGMVLLAQAGFTVNETIGTTDDVLRLAQAGALGLADAADIASSVLRGFRLPVEEAGRVMDVLALASIKTNANVGQLGEAMKFVAPIAAGMGVSIEEASAAIGVLSNAGLQGSLAGTGLRRVLSELEQPAENTAKLLKSLGVTTEEVAISQVGLTGALERLREAGVTTGQALEIFGDRGGPAFEVLASAIPDVVRLNEELDNAGGTAQRVADTMDDNLNGSVLKLRAGFQNLILQLGEAGATGVLRDLVDVMSGVLAAITSDLDLFKDVVESLAVALSIQLAAKAIPAVIAAVNRLTLAIAANPLGALAVGLTVATAALVGFADEITIAEGKTTTLQDVFGATFDVLGEIIAELGKEIEIVFEALNDVLGGALGEIDLSVQGVLEAAATVADRTLGLFQGLGNALIATFSGIGPAIGDVFFSTINGVIDLVEGGLDLFLAFSSTIQNQSVVVANAVLNFFRQIDAALGLLLKGEVDAAIQFAKEATEGLSNQLQRAVLDVPATFKSAFAQLGKDDIIPQLENSFAGAALELGETVVDSFFEGLDVTLVSGILDTIIEKADDAAAAAKAAEDAAAAAGAAAVPTTPGATTPEGLPAADPLLALKAELYEKIRGPQEAYLKTEQALGEMLASNAISAEEYAIALNDAAIAANTLSTDIGQGLQAGLAAVENHLLDLSGTAAQTVVNAFGAAEDALVQFATTGEINFSTFVDGLLADVARMLAQKALLGILDLFTGGAGSAGAGIFGALGSFFGGGKAGGGGVEEGKAYLVGEKGPELFSPEDAGTITPAGETAAIMGKAAQPVVNVSAPPATVQVVNVTDPDEIPAMINSGAADQAIMNRITRNRKTVRSAIAQ